MKKINGCSLSIILSLLLFNTLYSQDTLATNKTLDSLDLFKIDTLNLKLTYPLEKQLPKDILNIPAPKSQLDVDTRTGSYYTPRNVQDKMDQIMNRPRRDSFVPILGLAAFAVSVALKQVEAAKLFEPKAEDYLLQEKEFLVLEKLWQKSPSKIDDLYLKTNLKEKNTVSELQKTITALSDKNLIKTRSDGNNVVLFFPAQKLDYVKKMINTATFENEKSESEINQLKSLLKQLENIVAETEHSNAK